MLLHFIAQNALELKLFKQENKFQGKFVKFSQKLCLILSQIGNLILIFVKVQIKIVNAVICGKKTKCALQETNLFFILA